MSRCPLRDFLSAALLGALPLLPVFASAQNRTNAAASPAPNVVPAPRILFPPLPKPPVAFFRELLALSPAERTRMLTNRSARSRSVILDKLREYEALPPDARELRLRATELRWYLRPLMSVAPSNRSEPLAEVPDALRPLVQERLKIWDGLPAAQQKALLENETAIQVLAERATGEQPPPLPATGLNPREKKVETDIRHWQEIPQVQRQEISANFEKFFGLTPGEQAATLKAISEPERRQIEQTLATFGRLPPSKRVRCELFLIKFAGLSPEQRQQFFKNAEIWSHMTPSQREAWRGLVEKLDREPPLPMRRPPLPRGIRPKDSAGAEVVSTNGN